MTATLFNYLYRDADNYKAWGTIALQGTAAPECWDAALAKLESGAFFIAEQLRVPPLYEDLYEWSDGPTSADHCWHTFTHLQMVEEAEREVHRWGTIDTFIATLQAVERWQGYLSPHFVLGLPMS
jgi:hypothetical protein